MNECQGARFALKTATSSAHERVDAAFGSFSLAEREGYAAFLRAQAHAFLPVEERIDAAIAEEGGHRVLADWPERRRSHLLRADLSALNIAVDETGRFAPIESEEALLGAVYVLEGSRLGGRQLLRQVDPGLPTSFLAQEHQGGVAQPAEFAKQALGIERAPAERDTLCTRRVRTLRK